VPRNFVLLGPPGAGKGTQAALVAEKMALAHISSGNLFRENLEKQTDLGRLAKQYMEKGELVPDDVTISMVRERLKKDDCAAGALLDGFPRTVNQAQALDQMLKADKQSIEKVLCMQVADEILIERLSGRRICKAEGHAYHIVHNPPREAGRCDVDGSELLQREDDKAETVSQRLKVYHQQTAPLVDYYRAQGLLREIDGSLPIQVVTAEMLKVIES